MKEYHRIVSIVQKPECECVDLEVEALSGKQDPDEHSFYAEGFLVHNCVGKAKYKSGLRRAFIVPDETYCWVTADYSAEELRLAGIFSGESNLINPIKEGLDLHTFVAKRMFGFEDPAHRGPVKILNFSILYGAQEWTIARKINKTVQEAKELMNKYFRTMFKLKAFIDECHKQGRRTLMCFTYFGRPRLLGKYYNSSDKGLWGFADRTTVSHLIQGCSPVNQYLELSDRVVLMKSALGQRLIQKDFVHASKKANWFRHSLYKIGQILNL